MECFYGPKVEAARTVPYPLVVPGPDEAVRAVKDADVKVPPVADQDPASRPAAVGPAVDSSVRAYPVPDPIAKRGSIPSRSPYYYKGRVTGSRTGYSYRRGDARQGSGGCWQARKRCS